MTREEAINKFKGIRKSFSISIAQSKFYPSKVILNELCDMAIEALEMKNNCIICPRCGREFSEYEGQKQTNDK